jgi:hypothetical protein
MLAGCAAVEPPVAHDTTRPVAATSTPTPTPTPLKDAVLSGHGSLDGTTVDLDVPEGARSVTIDFTCEGDTGYLVDIGYSQLGELATLRGQCGKAHEMAWPLDDTMQKTLTVSLADDVAWKATAHFSTAEFAFDEKVTADCALFADVYSAFMNADSGYTNYHAFDADEWADRVAVATRTLDRLAATSRSSLHDPLTELSTVLDAGGQRVGSVLSGGIGAPITQISELCDKNQTPMILTGEFGG